MTSPSIGALVLAGGQNSRMGGTPKAGLLFQEATFLQRQAEAFQGFSEKLLSTNTPELAQGSCFQPIPDEIPGQGPMEGVASALAICKSSALVVVACDMPFITVAFTSFLKDRMANTFFLRPNALAIAVIDSTNRLHPLCGVYRKEAFPLIRQALDAGERRAMKIFRALNGVEVPLRDHGFPDATITNINDSMEFQELNNKPFPFPNKA